jgi:hypothetical protein
MTTSLTELFDAYSVRARLQPAFLAVLPVVLNAYLLWNLPGLSRILPIFVAAGGTFFLANLVRSRGLTVQDMLVRQWDGLPTTRALRLRTPGNAVLRERRRTRMEALTDLRLPSSEEETADPQAADEHYETAIKVLITKVREKPDIFPRVHEENTHYGFRRNLYSLKPLALVVLAIAVISCVTAGIREGLTSNLMVAGTVDMLALLAWLMVINREWVRQAGERYAERLFDTLEDRSLAA